MKVRAPSYLICAALVLSVFLPAAAQPTASYPTRPLRMIVPNAPGSSTDTLSRIFAARLGEALGQQVIVDNRAGAGGVIGMELGKQASPDGYTLITASISASTVAVLLQKKPSYDPVNDYAPVMQVASTPNVLVTNLALPVKTVREFIDYCKARSGRVNMASAGPGSQSHFAGAYLLQAGNFQSLHVPYKGGGASVAAVMAAESQWTLTPAPSIMSLVRAGRLRALGHSLPQRSPLLGDIAPIAEAIPGFDYSGWLGFLMPKGTPGPIVEKLRGTVLKIVNTPEMKEALVQQATEVVTGTAEEFRNLVRDSMVKNAQVVKAIGLQLE
jgi:tripartite-type tricarboxylate transporter receptor subunit TctC